jgi:hypothetical protein
VCQRLKKVEEVLPYLTARTKCLATHK